MADYVKINPNSKTGDLLISRAVFEQLATDATNKVQGVSVAKKSFKLSFLYLRINGIIDKANSLWRTGPWSKLKGSKAVRITAI